ncbi:unnamed protein product [Dracunculus medinensis]|uniref:Xaa-Pro dipeptidase n=1 Tax=Dracunculus medinensis TaxID=318479 RepID=A0A0N4UGN0_DRAME|nr:unnamed protein product [Dracunculus medinensis]
MSRGQNKTLSISAKLFAENRLRLVEAVKSKVSCQGSVIFLDGGKESFRYNTDSNNQSFRQESYFFWTFGVHESDFSGAVVVDSGKSILFPPRLHPDYAIWHGKINSENWFQKRYEVDEVYFADDGIIADVLKKFNAKKLLLLKAENSDSGKALSPAYFGGINEHEDIFMFAVDVDLLYPIITELRVFKTDHELEVMRYVGKVSSEGHKFAMLNVKPNMYEYQLESLFQHSCYFHGGCRHLAYLSIVASGANSSVLHYGHANAPNDKQIEDGDLCLLDMGAEYNCYASDITTTFPANGKFTENQKIIYNAVLHASSEVIKAAKPGIRWTDLHILAERIILTHLKRAGILKDDVEEMVKARLGAIFMPHGLGHFIGLDVHDCGGYLGDATPQSPLPGLKCLRTTRTLQERMVITVEPGCYFIDTLLNAALADPYLKKFIVVNRLNDFRNFGGVRIEDNVVIWNKGNEVLTYVPRTPDDIEKFMTNGCNKYHFSE